MRERRRRGAFCLVAALEGPAREAAAAAASATAAAGAAAAVTAAERDTARRGERVPAAVPGSGERAGGGRGEKGAAVATVEMEVSDDHVLGTLECSRHEFDGTPLAVDVEEGGAKISR